MQQAGLDTRIDNIGNVRGRKWSSNPNAPVFVIASHYDTVVNAGKYDGSLGILMGMDCIENLDSQELPFHIELIAFSDEEGVRFHTTLLGSEAVSGTFDQKLLQKKDDTGVTLAEVIEYMGGDPADLPDDAIPPGKCAGYFEIHIEQGPVLYKKNLPVAVVTGISGQQRHELVFSGEAGHAGTVPMEMRRDALCCAAEAAIKVEEEARKTDEIVATIGKLTISDAASNVIPGEVSCTLDIRSSKAEVLAEAGERIHKVVTEVCRNRQVDLHWSTVQQTSPIECDTELSQLLSKSIKQAGFEQVHLASGAGHDALAFANIAPVSMMFVRCYKGISHHPAEHVEPDDIADAIAAADWYLRNLINHYK